MPLTPERSTVIFRRAQQHDIPAMSRIRLAVSENALSDPGRITRQMYEDYLDKLGRGWVAEADGEITGFSYADNVHGAIWALFMSPRYEGQGHARRLLDLAADWLFAQGHPVIRLSTGVGTRAERFYARQGWTQDRIEGNDAYYSLANEVASMD
ncbi:GNAT superfamily N-acetyltransferase [Duganella sp. 1224]|uniref:GNAT family N-acetyltransferase n=1 Tax=Duganella sp. 1224 TaxID=2587052 RepID=UPI0017AA734C|nr:GNAT family N-acetyltransferase [Duganella sp. 1224]NYE59947.1 GNAT superfamily N-acetyltransferase [Duganella sp. 1224]